MQPDNAEKAKPISISSTSLTVGSGIMLLLLLVALVLYRDNLLSALPNANDMQVSVSKDNMYNTLVGGVNPFTEEDKFLFYGKQHVISTGQQQYAITPEAIIWHKEEEGWHNLLEIHKMYFEDKYLQLGNLTNGALFSIYDGELNVYENTDECVVAEYVSIVPLLFLEDPKNVLIIGGIDGLMLSKVLLDKRVKKVVIVGNEKKAIEAMKKYFGTVHKNAFLDERVQLIYDTDTVDYLKKENKFDLIIVANKRDHMKKETLQIIRLSKNKLSSSGIFVMQNEATKPEYSILQHYLGAEEYFDYIVYHKRTLLSVGDWGFLMASNNMNFMKPKNPKAFFERFNAIQGDSQFTKDPILRFVVPDRLPSMFYMEGNDKYLLAQIQKKRKAGWKRAEKEPAIVILRE